MIMTVQHSELALPEGSPASTSRPCCPQMCLWGSPTTGRGFRQLQLRTGNFICCCAQTRGGITTVPWLSSSFGSPHGTCWHPASHRAETTGLSSLKELFFWSSTNFAQLQESSKWCVYFLSHCSQWFAVLKYVCAGSIDSSIIFIASFRKLLFPSRD